MAQLGPLGLPVFWTLSRPCNKFLVHRCLLMVALQNLQFEGFLQALIHLQSCPTSSRRGPGRLLLSKRPPPSQKAAGAFSSPSAGAQTLLAASPFATPLDSPVSVSGEKWLPQTKIAQDTISEGAQPSFKNLKWLSSPTLLNSALSWPSKPSRKQNGEPSKPYFRFLQGHFSSVPLHQNVDMDPDPTTKNFVPGLKIFPLNF